MCDFWHILVFFVFGKLIDKLTFFQSSLAIVSLHNSGKTLFGKSHQK